MNRIIKFRAWSQKEMFYRIGLDEDGFAIKEKKHIQDSTEVMFDAHIMQFTGLKDKNGKEIYDGDIVKDKKMGISEISFFNASFTVSRAHFIIGKERAKYMEVIGNIYENPELLK